MMAMMGDDGLTHDAIPHSLWEPLWLLPFPSLPKELIPLNMPCQGRRKKKKEEERRRKKKKKEITGN
jgi:hypothetical protein